MKHTEHNPNYSVEVAPSGEVMKYLVEKHYLHKKIIKTKLLGYFVKSQTGQRIGAVMFSRPQFQSKQGLFGYPGTPDYWEVLILSRIFLDEGAGINVSSVIARITKNGGRRLQEDWLKQNPPRYSNKPIVPILLLSWADHSHGHDGTVYRAMSWKQWPDTVNGKSLFYKRLVMSPRLHHEYMDYLSRQTNFYVYGHYRKDTGELFYIGKGCLRRAKDVLKRSQKWYDIVSQAGGFEVKFFAEGLPEFDAFKKEEELIEKYRADGVNLVNITGGGDGASGVKMSAEQKAKLSALAKIRMSDPERIAQVKERFSTPEFIAKKIEGIKKHWADPVKSAEKRKLISKSLTGRGEIISINGVSKPITEWVTDELSYSTIVKRLRKGITGQDLIVPPKKKTDLRIPFTPGQVIGKWTMLEELPRQGRNRVCIARCECGTNQKIWFLNPPQNGCNKCVSKKRVSESKGILNVSHGLRQHPLYYIYHNNIKKKTDFEGWIGEGGMRAFYDWALANGWKKGMITKCVPRGTNPSPDTIKFLSRNASIVSDETKKLQRNNIDRMRRRTDPVYKLRCSLTSRTLKAFAAIKKSKPYNTLSLLGADIQTVKAHIEKQFEPWMNWENHGEWHIDHIMPLASAKTEEDMVKLCHYTNLQPLKASDNISKKDRIPCHQYIKKMQFQEPSPQGVALSKMVFAEESISDEIRKFVERYEWLGTVGRVFKVFTARYEGRLCCVQIMALPSYVSKNEIVFSRGCSVSWAPKNTATWMISRVIKHMSKNTQYNVFIGYADPEAGEYGTIYRAANFSMVSEKSGAKLLFKYNGRWIGPKYFTLKNTVATYSKKHGLTIDQAKEALKKIKYSCQTRKPQDKLKFVYQA
jgi:hypothetical protein